MGRARLHGHKQLGGGLLRYGLLRRERHEVLSQQRRLQRAAAGGQLPALRAAPRGHEAAEGAALGGAARVAAVAAARQAQQRAQDGAPDGHDERGEGQEDDEAPVQAAVLQLRMRACTPTRSSMTRH